MNKVMNLLDRLFWKGREWNKQQREILENEERISATDFIEFEIF